MYANEAYVLEALGNGASAYVLKDSSSADLLLAVREVAAGRRYLSPPLSDRAIEAYQEKARAATLDNYETLTTREREVLQLAAEGHTSSEIAARLGISPRTAETHRTHLIHKLGLRTQADLIRYALRRGIIPMED
jgi:DNA-binding NarL/FixJ family response regulator